MPIICQAPLTTTPIPSEGNIKYVTVLIGDASNGDGTLTTGHI